MLGFETGIQEITNRPLDDAVAVVQATESRSQHRFYVGPPSHQYRRQLPGRPRVIAGPVQDLLRGRGQGLDHDPADSTARVQPPDVPPRAGEG